MRTYTRATFGRLDLASTFGRLCVLGASAAQAGQSSAPVAVSNGIRPKVACDAMAGKMVPASAIALPTNGAVVAVARLEPGSGPVAIKANFIPEHCFIQGAIKPIDPKAPDINFGIAIPTVWNQQAWQIAGNGGDGFIPLLTTLARGMAGSPIGPLDPPHTPFPITQGFATFGDDSGHLGGGYPWNIRRDLTPLPPPAHSGTVPGEGGPLPAANAQAAVPYMDNDEAYRNFGYEHIKKAHDAVMCLIQEMYGVRPTRLYFAGESQGGRAALMAATRYPQDYDGVISSVPIAYYTGRLLAGINRTKLQMAPGAWVPPAKVRLVRDEVLRQCDALDGLADGVITTTTIACVVSTERPRRSRLPASGVRMARTRDSSVCRIRSLRPSPARTPRSRSVSRSPMAKPMRWARPSPRRSSSTHRSRRPAVSAFRRWKPRRPP